VLIRLLHRLYRLCWYSTVVLLIVAALLLTLARLLFPYVDNYRAEIEAAAGELIGAPLTLGEIDARLDGLTPTVILRQATLRDADGGALARLAEAEVRLDLKASLLRREPVIALLRVSGVELVVERQEDGRIALHGLVSGPAGQDRGGATEGQGIEALLLDHGQLQLRQARVIWRDRRMATPEVTFEADRIDLLNVGEHHRLEAFLQLPATLGKSLHLAADLTGDPRSATAWGGRLYLAGEGISPADWLGAWETPTLGLNLRQGSFDLYLWADWQAGQLTALNGEMRAAQLDLAQGEAQFAADRLAASFQLQRSAQQWQLAVDDLQWAREGRQFGPSQLRLAGAADGMELRLTDLPLADLAAGVRLLPQLNADQQAQLAQLAPRGELRQLYAQIRGGELAQLQVDLADIELQPVAKAPGVRGLFGRLRWAEGRGRFDFAGRGGAVLLPNLFRDPLLFSELSGQLLAQRDAAGELQLELPQLHWLNDDIALDTHVAFAIPPKGAPQLWVDGRFRDGVATAVPRYLPARIMKRKTVAWIDNAFYAGRAPSGTVRFYGALDRFPFLNPADGLFEVRFLAEGVDLFYEKGWPHLTDVSGEVVFHGLSMEIEGKSAQMFDSHIENARVGIKDLDHSRLWVEGQALLSENDPLRLLTETPLRRRFASYTYPELRFHGTHRLALDLDIPLNDSDPLPLTVQGRFELQGGSLDVADRLSASALQGSLLFDEHTLHADRITGQLLGGPVELTVVHEQQGRESQTRLEGGGRVAVTALAQFLRLPLLERLQGESAWHGRLLLPHSRGEGGEGGLALQLDSSLEGIEIPLPAPLTKPAAEARRLAVALQLAGPRRGELQLALQGVGTALMQLAPQGEGIERVAVQFGEQLPQLPTGHKLLVGGRLEGLDLDAWLALLRPAEEGQHPDEAAASPMAIEVAMERLALLSPPPASETEGEAAPSAPPEPPSPIQPQPVRAISLQIDQLAYGDAELGQLSFSCEPKEGGMSLQRLALSGGPLELSGQGFSLHDPVLPRTELELDLSAKDMGKMMQALGFASVIGSGHFSARGKLVWPGGLNDFTLARLGGTMHMKVQDGHIEELQPGAGRLLGLFSLQALPRRLLLDFRDLFDSGLRFNQIEGDFQLDAGNATTDNLEMESNAATITLVGRTGLHQRDYDQTVTVVPHVSSSLPVAGGLAWGPQVGAALLVFQQIFQPQLDSAAAFHYRVTGSWEQPLVEKVDSAAPQVGALPGSGQ